MAPVDGVPGDDWLENWSRRCVYSVWINEQYGNGEETGLNGAGGVRYGAGGDWMNNGHEGWH
jgi:hypothetical protein